MGVYVAQDTAALGLVLLPHFTVTLASKSEALAGKQHAFKVFNREHGDARQYIFAAESQEDMKTWMNVMGLASIAFGSGQASMTKTSKDVQVLADDSIDLAGLQQRAADRAGGVKGSDAAPAPFQVPSFSPLPPLFPFAP